MSISIIVPVYNTEKYLKDCIESILSQTYTDFELLLIDDGSTDKSGMICEEYSQRDSRIRVFHKENGGVSSARNLGLEQAAGDYLHFVDADDIVLKGAYEYLKDVIQLYSQPDVICFKSNKDKVEPTKGVIGNEKYYSDLREGVKHHFISSTIWCKVFKREFIQKANVNFYPIMYSEDVDFVWNLLRHEGTIVFCQAALYSYMTVSGSAVNSRHTEHVRKSVESLIQLNLRLKEYSTSYYDYPHVKYVFSQKYQVLANRIICLPYKYREIMDIFQKCSTIGISHLQINRWIVFFDFCYRHPLLYYIFQKCILKFYFYRHNFQNSTGDFINRRLDCKL